MVQAAQYIFEKLQDEHLIERAIHHRPDRGTEDFQIVIVGHSLGETIFSVLHRKILSFLFSIRYLLPL